jgi:hypothetical protein
MKAFVFPGQGGGVVEPAAPLLPVIRRVVGERIPDQVKIFARAAQDTDESRELGPYTPTWWRDTPWASTARPTPPDASTGDGPLARRPAR